MGTLSLRNKLAFPAGAKPGFDPSHPASRGASLSCVSLGGDFVSLLNGALGTVGSIAGSTIDGVIGRSTQFGTTGSGNNNYVQFAGPATTDTNFTFATIVRYLGFPAFGGLFAQGSAASGLYFEAGNITNFVIDVGANQVGSLNVGLPFAPNATTVGYPFFVAVSGSYDGTKYTLNCVFERLDTGQRITKTTTLTTAAAVGSGTYLVGNTQTSGGHSASAIIAAMTYNNTVAVSLAQLLQWSNDPWSFWYPDA